MKGDKGMFVQISKGVSRGLKLRVRCQEGNRQMFLDLIKHLLECFELFKNVPGYSGPFHSVEITYSRFKSVDQKMSKGNTRNYRGCEASCANTL